MRPALLFPLFLVTAAARGQDSPADRIAPFLPNDAILVGRVDLAAVNVEAALPRLAPFLALSGENGEELIRSARSVVEGLRKAGGRELFFVVLPSDVPERSPAMLVMTNSETDPKAIADVLGLSESPADSEHTVAPVSGGIFVGSRAILDRLAVAPRKRPELADAFASVANSPVQAIVIPSEDHRRVLREMLPDLPPDFGGLTGQQLAAGLRWAALGVAFEPKLAAKLVVQADSDQAAEAVGNAAAAGLRRLSTAPEVLQQFPAMPLVVGSLLPKREGSRLVFSADEALQSASKLLGDLAGAARQQSGRAVTIDHLKQFGLAFHNFHDNYGGFPPSAGYDGEKPLLSWRVYLLPYLGQDALYKEFRLNEPWDSEHNRKLLDRMPDVFKSPSAQVPPGHTVFLVPTGENLAFGGRTGKTLQQFTDGTSNTILVVEASPAKAVPWTKPDDLPIDPKSPLAGLAEGRERFSALLADGSARSFTTKIDPETFLHLLTPAGGEVIDWDKVDRP